MACKVEKKQLIIEKTANEICIFQPFYSLNEAPFEKTANCKKKTANCQKKTANYLKQNR